jgi:hypothetical protein
MPSAQRDEIINTPEMLEEVVVAVDSWQKTHDAARLNNMSLDEFMREYARGLSGEAGQA